MPAFIYRLQTADLHGLHLWVAMEDFIGILRSLGSVGAFRFSVCPGGGESGPDSCGNCSVDEHMSWGNGSIVKVFVM